MVQLRFRLLVVAPFLSRRFSIYTTSHGISKHCAIFVARCFGSAIEMVVPFGVHGVPMFPAVSALVDTAEPQNYVACSVEVWFGVSLPPRPVLSMVRPSLFCAVANCFFKPTISLSFCTNVLLNNATLSITSVIKVVWLLSRSQLDVISVARFANTSTAAAAVSFTRSFCLEWVAEFAYPC